MRQDTSDNALNVARVRAAEAQGKWPTAREKIPARLADIDGAADKSGIMGSKKSQLSELQRRGLHLSDNISRLLDRLETRKDDVRKGASFVEPTEEDVNSGSKVKASSARPAADKSAAQPGVKVEDNNLSRESSAPTKSTVEAAFEEAGLQVRRFSLQREVKNGRAQEARILSGEADSEFADAESKSKCLEQIRATTGKAQSDLHQIGPAKYAQTVRSLRDYAVCAESYLSTESNEVARSQFAKQATVQLEGLMRNVDNIYKGVNGQIPDLRRINHDRPFDAVARLNDIRQHLDRRMDVINNSQRARIGMIENIPVIKEILGNPQLVPDGQAVLFFDSCGKIVRATDNGAPLVIDGHRLRRGVDTDGAGLHRFIGHENIEGAAVIKVKLDGQGRPIPLRGSSAENPKYVKEVVNIIGTVPSGVEVGDSLGELMKRYGDSSAKAPRNPA